MPAALPAQGAQVRVQESMSSLTGQAFCRLKTPIAGMVMVRVRFDLRQQRCIWHPCCTWHSDLPNLRPACITCRLAPAERCVRSNWHVARRVGDPPGASAGRKGTSTSMASRNRLRPEDNTCSACVEVQGECGQCQELLQAGPSNGSLSPLPTMPMFNTVTSYECGCHGRLRTHHGWSIFMPMAS